MAIFKNKKSSILFARLYEELKPMQQKMFGEELRKAADAKITSERDFDDYYLTPEEVADIYDTLFGIKI